MKWKVKKINNEYVVGREQKTQYGKGSVEFVLPIYGSKIFKSKARAMKRAESLNNR